ncbi:MAG: NUDIX hydrolase [Candidatus Moranbacteria bacterium]|nr:NUDIX hydrolase [Candidatus Moranbacteria bacterium]
MIMEIPTKAAKAVIVKEDKILLLKRSPKNHGQDNWDLPGGLIDSGESEKEALVREVEEELGVEIEIESIGGKWKFFRPLDNQWVEAQNYICHIISGEIALSDEHIHFEWVSKENIKNYPVKDDSFYDAL